MTQQNDSVPGADGRKIIHIDMDAFFASVEQRDHPELKGKPIAVGYDGPRGVVATASYEARRFGVHSAMAMSTAKRYCPQLIVVGSDHHHYSAVSAQVHHIFQQYTDKIEPISIDEAFLDVTARCPTIDEAEATAQEIRDRIRSELHLTASAGISYNKLLAKIASDYRKPDGQFTVRPEEALDFIGNLQVEKLWGVGKETAQRFHKMGVFTGRDLRAVSLAHLREVFGKVGAIYYDDARGIDLRPVETTSERKSVGCEHTLEQDISRKSQLIVELYHVVIELLGRLEKSQFKGTTLTLKIKYGNFKTVNKNLSTDKPFLTKADILPAAKALLNKVSYSSSNPVRLIGLQVSNPYQEKIAKPKWRQGELDFDGKTNR